METVNTLSTSLHDAQKQGSRIIDDKLSELLAKVDIEPEKTNPESHLACSTRVCFDDTFLFCYFDTTEREKQQWYRTFARSWSHVVTYNHSNDTFQYTVADERTNNPRIRG